MVNHDVAQTTAAVMQSEVLIAIIVPCKWTELCNNSENSHIV